jgi:hypothetical protein
MKRYLVTSLVLALVALILFVYPQQFSSSGGVVGQKRRPHRVAAPPAARKGAVDYSRFSHATKQHQEACKTCHRVPTANWQKVRKFPDVADFPDHDACVRCHRAQFFKGAQPVVCTVCHTKTSPRDEARLGFRNPSRPQQFTIEFPHNKHQDVIATLRSRPKFGQFVGTSLVKSAHALDDKAKKFYNCEVCHVANTELTAAAPPSWKVVFAPFKASPENHASCFNCHWSGQAPTKDNCAGCHKLAATPYDRIKTPERISANFTHTREQHVKECTACHINITKEKSVQGLKPDVPITSCTECHHNGNNHEEIGDELDQLNKNQQFNCVYCHTSNKGKFGPPKSHYLAIESKLKQVDRGRPSSALYRSVSRYVAIERQPSRRQRPK